MGIAADHRTEKLRRMLGHLVAENTALRSRCRQLEYELDRRLAAERRLAEDCRLAETASRAKTRFLATASHDLRQPFQAMRLLYDVLLQRLDSRDGSMALVRKLGEAMTSSHRLLDNLLDFSTLESGGMVARVGEFAIGDVLERIEVEAATQAAAKGLELRLRTSGWAVRSDPVLLERMLRNLVSNAIRYTDRGGILIGCRPCGRDLLIGVWDTGRGIPADKLDLVFDDYNRLDADHEGVGLGLAIVLGLGRLLGHEVMVRSRPGRGSMFAVRVARA